MDEPVARLGERLMLPRQYEAHRAEIEAILPPIHLPVPASAATLITSATGPEDVSGDALGFIHRYVPPAAGAELARSEEHTSELQSRLHLVCRLLLEKKKKKKHPNV